MQNSKNDTIKLSLQETAQAGEVKEKLIHENDNLRVANTLLKNEMKLTRGRMLSLDNTRLIARQLTEQYSSDYDRELLARQIYNIFNHYDGTGDYDYVMNYLSTIGKRVVARSSAVDSSLYEDYEVSENNKKRLDFSSRFLARRKGLEPLTYWFVASHSIQLSYRRSSLMP